MTGQNIFDNIYGKTDLLLLTEPSVLLATKKYPKKRMFGLVDIAQKTWSEADQTS